MTAIVSSAIPEDSPNVWRVVIVIPVGQTFAQAVNMELLEVQLRAALPPDRLWSLNKHLQDAIDCGFVSPPTAGEQSTVNSTITAHDPTQMTPEQQVAAYIQLDLDYKDVFINASNVLETGLMGGVSTLAAYRTVLNNTIVALVPLVGTRFETHFNVERTAQGLPPSLVPNSMTLAQCAQFDTLLHVWLNARKVDAVIAQMTLG